MEAGAKPLGNHFQKVLFAGHALGKLLGNHFRKVVFAGDVPGKPWETTFGKWFLQANPKLSPKRYSRGGACVNFC